MKSNSTILLNQAWWKREQPTAIAKKSGKSFLEAIVAFEKANADLRNGSESRKLESFEKALKQIETAAKEVVREATALKKSSEDKKETLDLDNTIRVMGSPLARELDSARGSVAAAEEDADDSAFGSAEKHKAYLARLLPRLKTGAYSFAVVVPSADAADTRMALHRSKKGASLAAVLRKSVKKGRFTWGMAAAESNATLLAEEGKTVEDGRASTLVLALDGQRIGGLANKVKQMLAKLGLSTFSKVKLLVDGVAVEDDETPANDLPEDVAEDNVSGEPRHPLWGSLQELKRRILPLVKTAAERYPERKKELAKLLGALKDAETTGKYDLAIAILRDKIEPALRSASRMASTKEGDQSDIGVKSLDPSQRMDKVNDYLGPVLARTLTPPEPGFFASCFGVGGKVTSGKKFFDGVKIKFPDKVTPENAELLREWSVNMAILQHLGSTLGPLDSTAKKDAHKALMNRTVGYLLKFANITNTKELGWQSNPAQAPFLAISQEGSGYHRSGGSRLTRKVTEMTASKLGLTPYNCHLVSDPRALEEVRRNFSSEGELQKATDWSDEDYDRVLRKALANEEVFIDAGKEFKEALGGNQPIKSSAAAIISKLKERAFANATAGRGKPGISKEQLEALGTEADRSNMTPEQILADKKRVKEELELKTAIEKDHEMALARLGGVTIGGVVAHGEQHALVTFPFDGAKDPAERAKRITELLGHSGFTPGPEQLLDHWVSQTPNVAEILKDLGVTDLPSVKFPKGARLDTFDDVRDDFMEDATVKGFAALANTDDQDQPPPPYVKVTVEAMMSMIKGLQYGKHGFNVKSCLDKAGLGALWAITLNKIQGQMAKATKNKGSMRAFLDQTALIQEEIANLIAVAKPYKMEHFEKGIKESTDMFPDNFLGDKITADFTMKNSASRCFNSVLTACEDMKEQSQGSGATAKDIHLAKRGLEVMVQSDSYYEPSAYVLEHAIQHRSTELDTSTLKDDEAEFDKQLDSLKKGQDEQGRAKLDTYLCEFHHNISYGKSKYSPEDVTKQVRKMFDKGVVANPFTVAIDTTIAKTDEDAIKKFLAAFKNEIEAGAMNVAIYRSAQKFDQLGGDTYNGGVMCVVSKKQDDGSSRFQRALDGQGELPSEQNLQGLTHLNLHAQEQTNAYRTAIMDNTRKIADPDSGSKAAIPRTMLLTDQNRDQSLLQIAVSDDPETPFIDIKFPFVDIGYEPTKGTPEYKEWKAKAEPYKQMYSSLIGLFEAQTVDDPETMVSTTRASFGFQNANLTLIEPVKLRLNPGLEDEDRLKRYTDTLVDVNDMMMELKNDLDGQEGMADKQHKLEELVQNSTLLSLPVLKAHRELKAALTDTTSKGREKKQDNARLKLIKALTAGNKSCANPVRVLRLIGEMSAKFKQSRSNQAEVQRIQQLAELKLAEMRADTADLRLLEQGKAARVNGLVMVAEAKLGAIQSPFKQGSKEKQEFESIQNWVTQERGNWDENSEQRILTATKRRDQNDPAGVQTALRAKFPAAFESLRGAVIQDMRSWADEEVEAQNGKAAEDLFALANARIEQGDPGDAETYLNAIDRMIKENMPGLPQDTAGRVATVRKQAQEANARRIIDETLAAARDFEKVGNAKEAHKRIKWIDKIRATFAQDVASEQQTGELERLKKWAEPLLDV